MKTKFVYLSILLAFSLSGVNAAVPDCQSVVIGSGANAGTQQSCGANAGTQQSCGANAEIQQSCGEDTEPLQNIRRARHTTLHSMADA